MSKTNYIASLQGMPILADRAKNTENGTNIDSALGNKAENTPAFTEAATRVNLNGSNETMPTILGKVKKWFTDLKALAFKDTVGTGDIADDAITAAKVKDNETLPVNVSGSAGYLQYNTNEINFKNVPTTGNKNRNWFNFSNGDDATDTTNTIRSYWFGDRSNSVFGASNTILMSGGISNISFNGSTSVTNWPDGRTGYGCCCARIDYNAANNRRRVVLIRFIINAASDDALMAFVDFEFKVRIGDWHPMATVVSRPTTGHYNIGQLYWKYSESSGVGSAWIGIETEYPNSIVTPLILGFDGETAVDRTTLDVKFGDFNSELSSGTWSMTPVRKLAYFNMDLNKVGDTNTPVYVDTDGSVKPCSSALSGKADKVSGSVTGRLAALDANGNLANSSILASDVAATVSAIGGKQDALPESGAAEDTYAINISGMADNLRSYRTLYSGIGGSVVYYQEIGTSPVCGLGGEPTTILLQGQGDIGALPSTWLFTFNCRNSTPTMEVYSVGPTQTRIQFGYWKDSNAIFHFIVKYPAWCRAYVTMQCINKCSHFTFDVKSATTTEPTGVQYATTYNTVSASYGQTIGSQSTPVYVDSSGRVQPCTPSSMSVGSATNATKDSAGNTINSTYVNGKSATHVHYDGPTFTPDDGDTVISSISKQSRLVIATYFIKNSSATSTCNFKVFVKNMDDKSILFSQNVNLGANQLVTIPVTLNSSKNNFNVYVTKITSSSVVSQLYTQSVFLNMWF